MSNDAEQLGLPGMPRALFACTPSRLATYAACPRRYRMTYLDRPRPAAGPPWAHSSLGAAVHLALRAWFDLPVPDRTPLAAEGLLTRAWSAEGFRDDQQSEQWRERAAAWVAGYCATLDPAVTPLACERQVATKTDRLALTGRVDRIDDSADSDAVVIVDYKTGRWVPSADDARTEPALALYAVAAARTLRRACTRVELHHVPSGTVAVAEHSAESLRRQVVRAEQIAADAQAATAALRAGADPEQAFRPTPSTACSWCDVRQHCPEGRVAGPQKQPWAALAARDQVARV